MASKVNRGQMTEKASPFLKLETPKLIKDDENGRDRGNKPGGGAGAPLGGGGAAGLEEGAAFNTVVTEKSKSVLEEEVTSFRSQDSAGGILKGQLGSRGNSVQLDQLTREQIARQVLNEVFPPKTIMREDGTLSFQQVSSAIYTAADVDKIEWEIEDQAYEQGIRFRGVCDNRHSIYDQVFEELVRQEICVAPERGHLMARVRSECNLVVETYKQLFVNACNNSARKNILCQHVAQEMEERLGQVQQEKEELFNELNVLKSQVENQERRQGEANALEEKQRMDQLQFWKRTNQMLETNVNNIKAEWMEMKKVRSNEEYRKTVEDRKMRLAIMKERDKDRKKGEELKRAELQKQEDQDNLEWKKDTDTDELTTNGVAKEPTNDKYEKDSHKQEKDSLEGETFADEDKNRATALELGRKVDAKQEKNELNVREQARDQIDDTEPEVYQSSEKTDEENENNEKS